MRTIQALLLLMGLFPLAGCSDRPRAPVLRDDPVYQNDREGFRFLAPAGWNQSARANVPPGKATKERPLVEYRRATGRLGSSFRVSLADLDPLSDVAAFLAVPSFGAEAWQQIGPEEKVEAGNAAGVRYTFRGRVGKEETIREVVAVRRGERVYFFAAMFTPADAEVRDELRRLVASIIWKD